MAILYVNCPKCLAVTDTEVEIQGGTANPLPGCRVWVNCAECGLCGEFETGQLFYASSVDAKKDVIDLSHYRRAG